jgi:hypothetical protein
MSAQDRQRAFAQLFEEADEKQVEKMVVFDQHRFLSVERDKATSDRFVKGHKTMRAACDHLANGMMEGEPFIPEYVFDLDTGERHELDLFAFVVPRSVDAVSLIMPRQLASDAADALANDVSDAADQAMKILHAALK